MIKDELKMFRSKIFCCETFRDLRLVYQQENPEGCNCRDCCKVGDNSQGRKWLCKRNGDSDANIADNLSRCDEFFHNAWLHEDEKKILYNAKKAVFDSLPNEYKQIIELKPCPFCGGKAIIGPAMQLHIGEFVAPVQCSSCPAIIVATKLDIAVTLWNHRNLEK